MTGRTGRYRFRCGLFGACVLQYQVMHPTRDGAGYLVGWLDEAYAAVGLAEFRIKGPAPDSAPAPLASQTRSGLKS